jgi:hypothetical protein
VLVTLDAGTKLAETQLLNVVTEDGVVLSRSLHEGFIDFLVRNGHLE